MALKLDMSKAYDQLEWEFLWFMMRKLGFNRRWINWVQEYVTVTYSILMEGQPFGYFKPNKGLRQSDPLSPYLFLIYAEELSFLLHKVEQNGKIQGVRISNRCPLINHLLFANNSLPLCKASTVHCANVLEVLENYERLNGQMVNLNKSALVFNCNTPHRLRTQLAEQMRVTDIGTQDKYLGLPSTMHKSKKATFAYEKEKVKQIIILEVEFVISRRQKSFYKVYCGGYPNLLSSMP